MARAVGRRPRARTVAIETGRIMLTIPVYNPAGEQIGEESIDPADFGGEINKQLLHDVVLMHLAARRVGHGQHARPGRCRRARARSCSARKGPATPASAPSGRTSGRAAASAFARRNRDYRYSHAQEGRPGGDPHGPPVQVPGPPGPGARRPGAQSAQDQGRSPGPPRDPPARPERGRGHRGRRRDQEPGPEADPRAALDPDRPAGPGPGHAPQRPQHRRRQGRPGGRVQHLRYPQATLPDPDPRGARDPQGTGQAQAVPQRRAAARPPPRRADPWSPCVAPHNVNDAARCWSRTRS